MKAMSLKGLMLPTVFEIRFTTLLGIGISHRLFTNVSIAFVAFVASAFGAYSLNLIASFDIFEGENIYLPPTQSAAHCNILIGSPPVANPHTVPPSPAPVKLTRENTCLAWSCDAFSPIASDNADATS